MNNINTQPIDKINLMDKAYELLNLFYNSGYEAYPVGGCAREMLRTRNPWNIHDIDITTDATPKQIIAIANTNNIKWFQEGSMSQGTYGTVTVMYDDIPMQITPFRTDINFRGRHCDTKPARTLREDLRRRDFTVNAIALDKYRCPIDYFGGIDDIEKQRIRSIEKPEITYKRDKLRTMRAIRLATTTGFDIEEKTYEAIKDVDLNEINTTNDLCHYLILSKERIRDELIKILKSPNRCKGITLLNETGLLKQIIPEIELLKGIDQDERFHPEKDVFIHTMLAVKSLPPHASLELSLGTIFHDIAKPQTRIVDGNKVHFYEHEVYGSSMAEEILYRLKFKVDTIKKVVWLVRNHMRVHKFNEMKKSKKIKLISNKYFSDLTELLKADILGSSGLNKTATDLSEIQNVVEFVYEYEIELKERPILKEKLVNGYDVINAGISPKQGILIGNILEKINDEIIEGTINSREEALKRIKELVLVNNRYGNLETL